MRVKRINFHLLLWLPAFAMAETPLETVNAASRDVCNCLQLPYEVMQESMSDVRQAQINGDFSQIQVVQNKLLGIIQNTENCISSLTAKYPIIDQSSILQAKVIEKVDRQCPSPL